MKKKRPSTIGTTCNTPADAKHQHRGVSDREHNSGDSNTSNPCPTERLSKLILASQVGNALTYEESIGISEAVLEEDGGAGKLESDISQMIEVLCDYLDEMTLDVAKDILNKALMRDVGACKTPVSDHGDMDNGRKDEEASRVPAVRDDEDDSDIDEEDDGDSCYIQRGECELCEREMKLTRHHLIPKRTWKYIIVRFLSAASLVEQGDIEGAHQTLDLGDDFRLPTSGVKGIFTSRTQIKLFLSSYCASLCRPCHSCVHGNIAHQELAERFNTVDALLRNENVYKFCKWASKQKVGKYRY